MLFKKGGIPMISASYSGDGCAVGAWGVFVAWDSVSISAVIALSPVDLGDSRWFFAILVLSPAVMLVMRMRGDRRWRDGPVSSPQDGDISMYLDKVSCFVDGLNWTGCLELGYGA